jgi:Zn-dependent protease
LIHAEALSKLAAEAQETENAGDPSGALGRWNEALALLPTDAHQRTAVLERIQRLEQRLHASPAEGLRGIWVLIASAALFLLGKLKLLLLGFTKLGTLLSMLGFFGVYWNVFGWQFALGGVLLIYVHEMGHVAALRHYGIPASAPMFIPGIGALVRLKAHPPTLAQDARVGLAGPIWGTAATAAVLGLFQLTGNGLYASLTHFGAIINLFNLIPFWQLDGGRGILPLARLERCLLLVLTLGAFAFSQEGILVLIAIGLGIQCFLPAPEDGDRGALTQFVLLILALAWLATIRAPGVAP